MSPQIVDNCTEYPGTGQHFWHDRWNHGCHMWDRGPV